MTPVSVKIAGFLSYADEQELSFDGAGLWLLAGPNGSGKSAVFDAMTYALFGAHRGGTQNAGELINKEGTSLSVEFDFTLDGKLFRAKRTLRRAKSGTASGTQQVFAHAAGEWAAVADTTKKVDFDKWIHANIGLNYDTFTSSVLLLQGKAEKLLDSKPAGRAEVLAGIVDLERYQALHERAVSKRKALEAQADALGEQAAAIPEVAPEESAASDAAIASADAARIDAAARVTALAEVEVQARRWQDATARLAAAKNEVKVAEELLADAPKIEAAFARITELRSVLPAIHLIAGERAKVSESERKSERFQKDREQEKQREAAAERDVAVARATRDKLKAALVDYEQKHSAATVELRTMAGVMEKARMVETLDAELERLAEELKRFPADPHGDAESAQREVDRLAELERVVPVLGRFHTERADLARAAERHRTETAATEVVRAAGEKAKAEADAVQSRFKQAVEERTTAERVAAGASVLADRAQASLAEFEAQAGETKCRACGQPLTPAHFREEKAKRASELESANRKRSEAETARTKAVAIETDWSKKQSELKETLDALRAEFKDHSIAAKQATADVDRHVRFCKAAYLELPPSFQQLIAPRVPDDWTATKYPERDELPTLAREAAGLDTLKRHAVSAKAVLEKWQALRTAVETKRATRQALAEGLPADVTAIREKHATAHAAEAALVTAIKAGRRGIETAEREADTHARTAQSSAVALAELTGKLNQEDATRKQCREAVERAAKGLPVDWQLRVEHTGLQDAFVLQGELDTAVADGVEERYKRLDQARARRQILTHQATELAREVEAFALEHRRPPDEVRVELAAARQTADRAADAAHVARQAKAALDTRTARRTELGRKKKEIDADANHYKRLAELLGRDKLQRHLVRTAERQIVDHANAVLDRLSGGQLRLVISAAGDAGSADKALELDAINRAAGGSPVPVAFLSGSQKFRVAVALALGIGRYASRQYRPIESVIIDEGFGCLDRTGRQTMIQELHALRGQLARVLVVSHQEEFADAFSHGYKFELENGKTRVERFGE
ncbi:MAG TPA: SMC family ATPase [Fimbriiglobus sp.]|jgi:DNA repair exonuclease SbcCD ATPase subunit